MLDTAPEEDAGRVPHPLRLLQRVGLSSVSLIGLPLYPESHGEGSPRPFRDDPM